MMLQILYCNVDSDAAVPVIDFDVDTYVVDVVFNFWCGC